MKSSLYILYSLCAVSVTGRYLFWRREEATTSVTLSTSVAAAAAVVTSSPESSAAGSLAGSQTPESAAITSAAASSTILNPKAAPSSFTLVPGSAPTLTTSSSASVQTTTGDPVPLPISPKLTPAIGLAGAVLMITGLAYGLIGIRNKWLYTFLGVMYLVSLAVLVLILYCMNPPVSDGVQGAYFVAVALTGALCGGVALVFRDLADGVGCLLGGFCLAMWFLTLKAGGTISSTVGRAVFIGALTVIIGAAGLSKRTRRWGLMGSIPFSGATSTIIGVDCFSRAGMKEFWIYLWNLNNDEFPLNTTTYPITRGMKVEIAGIMILFLLGLIAQIKLAKVLKERKQMFEEKKMRKLNEASRGNTAIGKRVPSQIWQSVNDDQSASKLTVLPPSETLDKKGFTVKERPVTVGPDLEMANIRPTSNRITITEADNEIGRPLHLGVHDKRSSTASRSRRSRISLAATERGLSDAARNRESQVESMENSLAPPAPEVVPLPFKIPSLEVNRTKSQGSLSAIEDFLEQRRNAPRVSAGSWKRVSGRSSIMDCTASREELMKLEDDDNTSSVAATFDELDGDHMSLSAMTLPHSPMEENFSLPSPLLSNRASIAASLADAQLSPRLDVTFTDEVSRTSGVDPKPAAAEKRDSVSPAAPSLHRSEVSDAAQSLAAAKIQDALIPISSAASKRSSAKGDARKSEFSDSSADKSGKLKSVVPQGPTQPLTQEVLTEQVVDGVSRITLQYRTNEWAKHLEGAQEPEEDRMTLPPSPGVRVDTFFQDALEHTPLSPVVDPAQITATKPVTWQSSTEPTAHQRKKSRSEALAKLTSGAPPAPPSAQRQNSERIVSSPAHSRPTSSTIAWPGPAQRASRNVSSPVLGQPIVESPIEARMEDSRRGLQKRTSTSRTPVPESTLMAQRESRLEAKPKSQSFAQSAPNLALISATPVASVHGKASPLQKTPSPEASGRTSQLQHMSSSRQGAYTPQPVITTEVSNFDSHQPHRRSNAALAAHQHRRENLLTNWRESLRENQNPQKAVTQQKPIADEAQRMRLLQEKRQRQAARAQEKLAKAKKEERISSKMMTGGNLIDAHRMAMQKMQSGVKQ